MEIDRRQELTAHLDAHPEIDEGSRIGFQQIREGKFIRVGDELIDPHQTDQEMREFRKEAKAFDPMSDKRII